MGECGCGDGFGDARFPGSDRRVYALDVYTGCVACSAPAGITIHRYGPGAGGDMFVDGIVQDIPEARWTTHGPDDGSYSWLFVPMVCPERLAAELAAAIGDVECEHNGERYKLSDLLDEVLYDVIGDHVAKRADEWLQGQRKS